MNPPLQGEEREISWNCRFHPTDWFHEIGCSHQEWTKEQLQAALETAKKSYDMSQSLLLEAEKRAKIEVLQELQGFHNWNGSPPRRYREEDAEKLMYEELTDAIDQTLTRIMEGGE